MADSSAEVEREGYLYKQPSSGKGGAWQRRYLVVSRDAIRWYTDEGAAVAGKPKGAMPFSPGTVLSVEGEGEAALLAIAEGKRRLTLKATRYEDLHEWREAITELIEPLRHAAASHVHGVTSSSTTAAAPGAPSLSMTPGRLLNGAL